MADACSYAAIEPSSLSYGDIVHIVSKFGFHPVPSPLFGNYTITPLPWDGKRIHADNRDALMMLGGLLRHFETQVGGSAYSGGDVNDQYGVGIEPVPPDMAGWDRLGVGGDAASWRSETEFIPNFLKLSLALTFALPICPFTVLDSRCVNPDIYFDVLQRKPVTLNVDDNPAVLIVDPGFSQFVTQTGTGAVSFIHRSKVVFTVEEWVGELKNMLSLVAPE